MRCGFLMVALWCSAVCGAVVCRGDVSTEGTIVLRERDVHFRTRLRMQAKASRMVSVENPLDHPEIEWVIPDGSWASSGQVLAAFSPETVQNRLEDSRLEEGVLSAGMVEESTAERDQELTRQDELLALLDERAVLEAQLARLRALPEPGKVMIAEGKLRVATLEAEAAARELDKARDRFARGMISEAELREAEFALREREAGRLHAEKVLAFQRRPAKATQLDQVALQIASASIEIKRKQHEIEQNKTLRTIKRQGSGARREIVLERIREAEEAVDKLQVLSPQDGYVTYKPGFKSRYLESARRMHKKYPFLLLPDQTQLVFTGSLQESDRQFLVEGDRALVRVVAHESQDYGGATVLTGRVESISVLSRDQSEKDERGWGEDSLSGVKVYDVRVALDVVPSWLRIGMHAEVELMASTPMHGVAVPAGFVTVDEHGFYLGLDGVLEEVEGTLVGDQFLLRGSNLVGRTATLFAQRPPQDEDTEALPPGVHVLGELVPTDTDPVRVGDVGRWIKVAWLIPENAEVRKGDLVARLDGEAIAEGLTQRQSELQEARSDRQGKETQHALKETLDAWALEKARNTTELRRLLWVDKRDGRDDLSIVSAEYQLSRAEISLARLEDQYARSAAKGHRLLSPLAKGRLERDLERSRLSLESARMALAERRRGPLPTELRREELRYLDGLRDAEDLGRRQAFESFSRARGLSRARQLEARAQRRVAESLRSQENLKLYAPRDGVVRYGKVWDSGRIAKVKEGTMVGARVRIMEIAGVSQMAARVGVSERYYKRVEVGMPVKVSIPSMNGVILDGTVEEVEFLFEDKRRADAAGSIYSIQENLGETQFFVRVKVATRAGTELKPGTMAEVVFPFNGEAGS